MITLYNVVSADGFIAQEDGSEDFIPDEVWNDFLLLCNEFDTLIIGKNTYLAIQNFGKALVEPFENTDIQKIVITRDENFIPKNTYRKVNSIHDAVKMGSNILLSSGPSLNTAFLKEKCIDRIIFNKLPATLGIGILQFETDIDPQLTFLPEHVKATRGGRKLEFYAVSYN